MSHLAGGGRSLVYPDGDVGGAMKFCFRPHMVSMQESLTTPAVSIVSAARGSLPVLPPMPSLPWVMQYWRTWRKDGRPLTGATAVQ